MVPEKDSKAPLYRSRLIGAFVLDYLLSGNGNLQYEPGT